MKIVIGALALAATLAGVAAAPAAQAQPYGYRHHRHDGFYPHHRFHHRPYYRHHGYRHGY